ncbi:Ig-like domain-containing protein [Occallatibacter savannae]|uniref:Ig-like domain-containing protein n=1 Tax=Occallatibacter savannae TaxID=1002691 RepID=UPI001EF55DCC|nr:Ig-like domain-containing protein [Occallatibacter savannae]
MFRQWAAVSLCAIALPALAAPAAVPRQATQTSLVVDTRDVNGHTEADIFVAVSGSDGLGAPGSITLMDGPNSLGGLALDAQGQAASTITLPGGSHSLRAVYSGDTTHAVSNSRVSTLAATAGTTPDFSVAVAPGSTSLKQGQSGSAVVTVTPINAASLAAPMFVTISCSGLPDQTSCTFTPENIEIPVGASKGITSSMVIATQGPSIAKAEPSQIRTAQPVAWAILLPGALTLGGLAFGLRRRFLSRLTLMALLAFVGVLGSTGCSPLYNYRNHGPTPNLPTPTGTYNVTVSAQSSNGVTATTHATTLALTVTK